MSKNYPEKQHHDVRKKVPYGRSLKKEIIYPVLILVMIFFMLGFVSQKNALVGEWECNADKTIENLDTGQLSEMEKQYYYNYFQNVSLEISEKEMVSRQAGRTDSTTYEIVDRQNNEIIVYYPEEDRKDSFKLLERDRMKWSLDTERGIVDVYFEKE